jgi:alpha-N-arabinofuranosidase
MAIPEFILQKLIVPDSFRSTQTGFTFKILNNFGAATITRFMVLVGDEPVPAGDISISSDMQMALHGDAITPESPMLLPVGMVIRVDANAAAGHAAVRLTATTKEVGEISMTLNSGKPAQRSKSFRRSRYSFLLPIKHADITIHPEQELGKASSFILGQFVEHLERCVYDGIWKADGRDLREDTLDLVRQLNPPLIRYPGGNFASCYHWEDGIGPIERRPTRHDAAWQAEESNHVGTDEFLRFCEEIGAEPVLVVNDGTGSPDEAARWVAYCNNPVDTEQGARRASNGHPEPHNVKYWVIGNEVWDRWRIGTTSAQAYCRRAERFIDAMKAVDPEIKYVLIGQIPLAEDSEDEGYVWNETVLRELSAKTDYLSWHIYQPDRHGWQEVYNPHELYHAVNVAHLDIENIIARVDAQIRHYAGDRLIQQAIDEWNLWLPPREENVSIHRVTYTMRDSLYAASVLMTFFKHSQSVGMSSFAQLVNVLPLIETNAETAIATAMFLPFVLFNQMQHIVLKTDVQSDTFESGEQAVNLLAHSKVPFVDALATGNDDRSIVTLMIVNRHPFHKTEVNIQIDTLGSSLAPIQSLQIYAPSPEAFNSFEKPNRIKLADAPLPVVKNDVLKARLKPCSVYFVEFNKQIRQA